MSRVACLALLLLAACPKPQSGTTVSTPQAGGAGCPPASGVYIASYVAQEPNKGRSGWVVPLASRPLRENERMMEYSSFDAPPADAGIPAPPGGTLWLATATGMPCKATLGKYYAAVIETTVSYGVELDGCPTPQSEDEGGGIVLATEAEPTGCRFETPQPVAARLGQMDAQKQWQRPTTETPMPAALAAVVPQKECTVPACEKLWAFGEVKIDGKTVAWSGAVNWLAVGDPAQQCSWPAERFSGFFVPGASGNAVKVTEGQTHPLVLSAVLADSAGPKVLLAEGPGEYATYDVVPGGAKLGHAVTWMAAPAEAWDAVDHIGPICDPQR
jgi:hypothetical protein